MRGRNNNSIAKEYYNFVKSLPRLTQQDVVELYKDESIDGKTIEDEIEELEKLLENSAETKLLYRIFGDSYSEKMEEIIELEQRLEKLRYLSRNYDNVLYRSTRGLTFRNRKFPSVDLRNKIVTGHLYLAVYLAGVYFKNQDNTISFDDLVQSAYKALVSAAYYYVPNERAKFTTYASKCISNSLKREIYPQKCRRSKKQTFENYLQGEKDKVAYMEMFLNAIKDRDFKFKGQMGGTLRRLDSSILRDVDLQIKNYNQEKIFREEANRIIKRFLKTKSVNDVLDEYFRIMKEGKISVLITEEERDIINLLVSHEGVPQGKQILYETFYCLQLYLKKIDDILLYITAENESVKNNEGIVPTDEELLREINEFIKRDNKEIFQLRKSGFFDFGRPSFRQYCAYRNEYLDTFGYDFFAPADWSESRTSEREDIASFYNERLVNLLIQACDELRGIDSDKVVLYYENDENDALFPVGVREYVDLSLLSDGDRDVLYRSQFCEWELEKANEDLYYRKMFRSVAAFDEMKIISKEEATLILDDYFSRYKTLDVFIDYELECRKKTVNEQLEEKNGPIREYNRSIKDQIDKYDAGKKYKKYLDMDRLSNIKRNIEILYSDDDSIFDYDRNGTRQSILSVEDEALQSVFLSDYYNALLQLPEIQGNVLKLYFDENGERGKRASEIASELGISEARVYKEKDKALRKLRTNPKMISYYNANKG